MHDIDAFINRLRKVMRQRKSWAAREQLEAYRIYDHDIPEYRYIVDLYGKHAVIYDRTRPTDDDQADRETDDAGHERPKDSASAPRPSTQDSDHDEQLADADLVHRIGEALGIPPLQIHLKKRRRMPGTTQYEKLAASGCHLTVNEGPLRFLVNLTDYLDTGLFLDHRPLRAAFVKQPVARLLNLFCYTGSMSVAAAYAGASTTSVDLSATYLDWAAENFKVNSLSLTSHRFERADARVFLADGPKKGEAYNAIFLDPPTFSNSKRMKGSFDVQRDHRILVDQALNFLSPDGTLYFSTNRRRFQLDEILSRRPDLQIIDCTESTIPLDFRDRKIHRCFQIRRKT